MGLRKLCATKPLAPKSAILDTLPPGPDVSNVATTKLMVNKLLSIQIAYNVAISESYTISVKKYQQTS